VQNVIGSCARTLHALRILRAYGLCDVALQNVYRSVVVARLLYAASACWRFTTTADRQRIEGFLCRGVRAGYRRADAPTAAELVEDSDDQLFHSVQYDSCHVLHPLLPDRRTDSHALRTRRHNFSLACRVNATTDSNFITRQLFKDSYRHSFLCFYVYSFVSILAFYLYVFQVVALCLTTLINEYEYEYEYDLDLASGYTTCRLGLVLGYTT